MKLNIEELAKQAGALPERDETFGKVYEMEVAQLEAFARLIVERCAVECDKRGAKFHAMSPFSAEGHGLAAMIRNLLESK